MDFPRRTAFLRYANVDVYLVVGLIMAIVGLVVFLVSGTILAGELPFVLRGVRVEARIVNKFQAAARPVVTASLFAHGGGGKKPSYRATYEFLDAAGGKHQGSAKLSGGEWRSLREGDPLEVIYLPDRPDQSRRRLSLLGWMPANLGITLLGLLAMGSGVRLVRQRIGAITHLVDLLETGTPVPAMVDDLEVDRKARRCTVTYRYFVRGDDDSADRSGKVTVPLSYVGKWDAKRPLLVLVDPEDPADHVLDLFNLRPADRDALCARLPARPGDAPAAG